MLADFASTIQTLVAEAHLHAEPKGLYEPINYILTLGGKRVRPLLCLLGCDLFGSPIDRAYPAALAVEFFHNFSLLHDDIMDNAPLRRGQPTVHERYNTNTAILSGDAMLVKAYEHLCRSEVQYLPTLMAVFNKMAVEVCEGQQYDMDFETTDDVSIDHYLEMIWLKTAVLLGAALQMGAIVGGATEDEAQLLYNFGVDLGVAFQLQDDLLDTYGNPETFGKQVGGDILQNKKTFLLLKTFATASDEQQSELQTWLDNKDVNQSKEKVSAVRALYD